MTDLVKIGQSLKPHGKEGKIKLHVEEQFEQDLSQARTLFINLDGSKVPFLIVKIDFANQILINLDEVITPEAAAKLSHKAIFLEKHEVTYIPQSPLLDIQNFVGFKIYTQQDDYIGTIINVIENTHQDLFEVEAPRSQFMVPFHEDLIVDVKDLEGKIVMDLPEGLDSI